MKRRYKKIYRSKKKKSFFKKSIFFFSSFSIIILGSLFIYFLFSEKFKIKEILISDTEKIKKEEILPLIKEASVRNFLNFKIENIFLTNKEKIENELRKKFPQISAIELNIKIPHRLEIKLREREKIAIFCVEGNCYFIDQEGVAFEEARNFSNFFKIINSSSFSKVFLGEKVIDPTLLKNILEIKRKIDEIGVEILSCEIVSENRINFETKEKWFIFINPKKEIDWQITKLKVSLKEIISPEKREKLEYIDLRFGNFAYPKYR